MDIKLITSLIALFGVVLSVLLSFLSNRQVLRSKLREIESEILQQNSDRIFQKRLDFYPQIYFILSEMAKFLKKDIVIGKVEMVNHDIIANFIKQYESIDSKFGILYSTQSGINAGKLRNFLLFLLDKDELIISDFKELKDLIGQLEFSLKQDIGIYIEELQSLKLGRGLKKYSDVGSYLSNVVEFSKELNDYRERVIRKYKKSQEIISKLL